VSDGIDGRAVLTSTTMSATLRLAMIHSATVVQQSLLGLRCSVWASTWSEQGDRLRSSDPPK
jgi:hypothetical protein